MKANPLRIAAENTSRRSQQELCDDANTRMLAEERPRRDVRWYVHDGQVRIGWNRQLGTGQPERSSHIMDRDRKHFRPDDWEELNVYLADRGSMVRYRPNGERYTAAQPQTGGWDNG